jgi:hypothetical protein
MFMSIATRRRMRFRAAADLQADAYGDRVHVARAVGKGGGTSGVYFTDAYFTPAWPWPHDRTVQEWTPQQQRSVCCQ